jgi:hypothetical protein
MPGRCPLDEKPLDEQMGIGRCGNDVAGHPLRQTMRIGRPSGVSTRIWTTVVRGRRRGCEDSPRGVTRIESEIRRVEDMRTSNESASKAW